MNAVGCDDRHCDWHGKCKRKPYVDVFPLRDKPESERELPCDIWYFGDWSYLCFWHFQYERIRFVIKRNILRQKVALGYGKAETSEEYLYRLAEEEEWELNEKFKLKAKAEADAELEALDMEINDYNAELAEESGYYDGTEE